MKNINKILEKKTNKQFKFNFRWQQKHLNKFNKDNLIAMFKIFNQNKE